MRERQIGLEGWRGRERESLKHTLPSPEPEKNLSYTTMRSESEPKPKVGSLTYCTPQESS